ncbi:uncharacterized protein LOC105632339 isoform X2 [Jatropha curcas]|uniref:uncharacterized protein LOC105632339 isoform X2 n=1 Tax=Jatropha curcas TaxID=180498 RepID=UPI0009D71F95|nr:uncharacterized protein LOC105632339 isoform X2 [Jatropha curcas]
MQTHHPNSQLALLDSVSAVTNTADSESQKAWYILALLISIGRPTSTLELASRCTLFRATPEIIRSLCSIPNSPITLTSSNSSNGFFVTVSLIGLFAFQRFISNINLTDAFVNRIERVHISGTLLEDVMRMYLRKRKRIGFDFGEADEKHRSVSPRSKRIRNDCAKVHFVTNDVNISINAEPSFMSIKLNNILPPPDLFTKTIRNKLVYRRRNVKQVEDGTHTSIVERMEHKRIMAPVLDEESALMRTTLDSQVVCQEAEVEEVDLKSRTDVDATSYREDFRQSSVIPMVHASANDACDAANDCYIEAVETELKEEELLNDSSNIKQEENFYHPINTVLLGVPIESVCTKKNELIPLGKELTNAKNQTYYPISKLSVVQEQLSKPSAKMKLTFGNVMTPPRQQNVDQSLVGSKVVSTPKEKQEVKRNLMEIDMAQKSKEKRGDIYIKEGRKNAAPVSPLELTVANWQNGTETKDLPYFESYIVEEEEGSGGYGTVYRARRKSDGATVAIKCPHENAHRHHVSNELRMLERFGGKNFVIKYEGCFKSGNSDCFVLEHVEHDRPEVLKKEIDIFQLRWYGYCMFRALASLHKQGIVHRDVKPGNFLFSRKANKGYLIDFNLAMDLRQKYGTTNKSKTGNDVSLNHNTLPNTKSIPPAKSRRFPNSKSLDVVNLKSMKGLKPTLEPKNQKKRAVDRTKAQNDLSGWNIMKSQGADGSGITSAKDVTSTRTPSVERLREPLPCQGRKELISLLQEAMQSPNHEASSVPASMRKRIAAPARKVDEILINLTPMPLHSTRIASPATCLIKNKDGNHKKEGPCVGTKGFRAPEVLFRSTHQGPKVDIWSAGVTLLYLMIGRTPFYGDPEQNIKDIAKLRGSEDLWEVSKLHDRELSFPAELYKLQSLPSVSLREWCKINTKRREFNEIIPSSLIDLVDKCLTVNPRLRISAEDALKHEFFVPCHEGLRKQRLLRQGLSLETGTSLPLHGQSTGNGVPVKISHQQS